MLPLGHEAKVLSAANGILAGALVGDAVLAASERGRAVVVVRVLLRSIEAGADNHCRQLCIWVLGGRELDRLDGEIALSRRDLDTFAGDRQGGNRIVKDGGLLVLYGLDKRVTLVLVDIDIRSAVVIRCREPRVPHVNGVVGILRILGLGLGRIGKSVELLMVGVKVARLDVLGSAEDRANVRSAGERVLERDKVFEIEGGVVSY